MNDQQSSTDKPSIDKTSVDKLSIDEQIQAFDTLSDTMHQANKKRTLEEQVAYLKSKGIDPAKSYAKWDDEEDD